MHFIHSSFITVTIVNQGGNENCVDWIPFLKMSSLSTKSEHSQLILIWRCSSLPFLRIVQKCLWQGLESLCSLQNQTQATHLRQITVNLSLLDPILSFTCSSKFWKSVMHLYSIYNNILSSLGRITGKWNMDLVLSLPYSALFCLDTIVKVFNFVLLPFLMSRSLITKAHSVVKKIISPDFW